MMEFGYCCGNESRNAQRGMSNTQTVSLCLCPLQLNLPGAVLLECSLTALQAPGAVMVKPKWSWVPAGDLLPFHPFAAELL